MRINKDKRQRIGPLLILAFLLTANLFLFGPFTLYQGNIGEFAISLPSLLAHFVFPALGMLFLLFIAGLLPGAKGYPIYQSILLALGALTWLQGNLLVWKYGLLDGQGMDFSRATWRGAVDALVWVLVLTGAVIFSRKIFRKAGAAGGLLILIQFVSLIFISTQNLSIWKGAESFSPSDPPPGEIYRFSPQRNIIHILMDSFQSDIFFEIINRDFDRYADAMQGFTFFKDTVGSFPTTHMSIPAIFSGKIYKNDIPMPDFLDSTLNHGNTIISTLSKRGYDIDIAGVNILYGQARQINQYIIPVPYGIPREDYEKNRAAFLFDLVLFRAAPHFLKPRIYNNQLWLLQNSGHTRSFARELHPFYAHTAFLEDLYSNIQADRSRPVYKLFHLMTPHAPYVVNANCSYSGKVLLGTRENIKNQAACSLDTILEFFDRLKKLDIYESALIILQADTGAGARVQMNKPADGVAPSSLNREIFPAIVGAALPLLAVKPPHSRESMQISMAPVMLSDVSATVSSLLELDVQFPGRPVFELSQGESRERKFYYYEWIHANWQADYFDRLEEFTITGSVLDINSWSLGSVNRPGDAGSFAVDKIDFGTAGVTRFLRFGWSDNEINEAGVTFNWALGNAASVILSLPRNEKVILTANLESLSFDESQTVTIRVDGRQVGQWELQPPFGMKEHSVEIRPDPDRPKISVVEFLFSKYRKPEGDSRPLAVVFESITIKK